MLFERLNTPPAQAVLDSLRVVRFVVSSHVVFALSVVIIIRYGAGAA